MAVFGKHGVTTDTPKNVLLGAGTFVKNLEWKSTGDMWGGTMVGATTGGGKLAIEGEYLDLDIDGALVLFKGQTVKVGGKASMEFNLSEISGDNIKMATNFQKELTSDAVGYDLFVDKPNIEEGDYLENFGFVGKTADGSKDIVIIFEYALCKSAFEIETKNKEQSTLKVVLEAYAKNEGKLDTIPVKIYYPTATA